MILYDNVYVDYIIFHTIRPVWLSYSTLWLWSMGINNDGVIARVNLIFCNLLINTKLISVVLFSYLWFSINSRLRRHENSSSQNWYVIYILYPKFTRLHRKYPLHNDFTIQYVKRMTLQTNWHFTIPYTKRMTLHTE